MLKIYLIPKTHGREDAFYAQNCIKQIIITVFDVKFPAELSSPVLSIELRFGLYQKSYTKYCLLKIHIHCLYCDVICNGIIVSKSEYELYITVSE